MIYVVAAPQNLHFQQLFKILELMGYEWAQRCVHVNFGMVKLPRVRLSSTDNTEFLEFGIMGR